jgi:hypothetical protein
VPCEQDVRDVVVAVAAQRLPKGSVRRFVRPFAPKWLAVMTIATVRAWRVAETGRTDGVYWPEAWRCEGHEHLQMQRDSRRHVVVPPLRPAWISCQVSRA